MLTSSRFIGSNCDCDIVCVRSWVSFCVSVEACDVLLFLLWLIQSISESGRRTLWRGLAGCAFVTWPVELVRGGMAFGEAKGCVAVAMSRSGGDYVLMRG